MDVLVGLLIIAALVLVLARPFRNRSSRDESIYRRLSGLDVGEINRWKPCPYCAEMIHPEARECRYCGRQVPRHED